jgi:hypothetical protein
MRSELRSAPWYGEYGERSKRSVKPIAASPGSVTPSSGSLVA